MNDALKGMRAFYEEAIGLWNDEDIADEEKARYAESIVKTIDELADLIEGFENA